MATMPLPPAGGTPAAVVQSPPPARVPVVKSAVRTAQKAAANFRPHAAGKVTSTVTSTVGRNPHPPATPSRSHPDSTDIPMTAGNPIGYAPYSQLY